MRVYKIQRGFPTLKECQEFSKALLDPENYEIVQVVGGGESFADSIDLAYFLGRKSDEKKQ
jgi:hypothetical protein